MMGTGDEITMEQGEIELADLGRLIREARRGRYTLEELATTAGVSPGLLSQLERGLGNPSFRTLRRVAGALGLRVGDLLQGNTPDDTGHVVRVADRKRLQLQEGGLTYELLSPNLSGQLEVLATNLPPGFENSQHPFNHIGEECVLIVSGSAEVTVGDVTYQLFEGDAITYDSSVDHWWRNTNDQNTRIFGVVTPPSF